MSRVDYIERSISDVVLEAAKYFPVVCITGPRQSGKTTLVKHLFPDFERFTLENVDTRTYAQHDPIAFLGQTEKGMVIEPE